MTLGNLTGQQDPPGGDMAPPPSSAPEKTSYNLVVCGATDPQKEGWMFSDFMGYCMTLKKYGIAGDLYSCFPIEETFCRAEKQR